MKDSLPNNALFFKKQKAISENEEGRNLRKVLKAWKSCIGPWLKWVLRDKNESE